MRERKLETLKRKLRHHLDKERYEHTLGVMYTAAALAMAYGVDMEKALLAGLLHDCAKCISENRKLRLCKKYGLSVNQAEECNPGLLHAKLGAYLAEKKYKVQDSEVLDAICYHTTGRPHMSMMDKIIYLADYIEPNRKMIPGLTEIRHLSFTDIEQAVCQCANSTLKFLEKSRRFIDPMTQQTYEYYRS